MTFGGKKMKPAKIKIFIIVILILCSILLSGIATPVDLVLNSACAITRKIFDSNMQDGSTKKGYISARYLKGLDDSNNFILAECDTGGYAIFDKESMELIQYSDSDISPFFNISKEHSYYAGPSNYFMKENDTIVNIKRKDVKLNKEQQTIIADAFKQKMDTHKTIRNQAQSNAIYTMDKEATNTESSTNSSNSTHGSGPTGLGVKDADKYHVISRKYIPQYQFFIDNHNHGNYDSSCTITALQLLLAFNNWGNDGRIIPYNPNANEYFLPYITATEKEKIYGEKMLQTTSSVSDTDGIITFFEKLLYYVGTNTNGTSFSQLYQGALEYLVDYAPQSQLEIALNYGSNTNDSINVLKHEINNNRPAIAGITYYGIVNNTLIIDNHSVVVYGYQTIKFDGQELNGFIAHMGWENTIIPETINNTNVWFNENWVNSFFTFQTTHTHQDFAYNSSNHIVQCSICSRIASLASHKTVLSYPIGILNDGIGVDPNQYSILLNKRRNYHIEECMCGYKREKIHTFIYTNGNENGHIKECRDCGYVFDTLKQHGTPQYLPHLYKASDSCWYCSYQDSPKQ